MLAQIYHACPSAGYCSYARALPANCKVQSCLVLNKLLASGAAMTVPNGQDIIVVLLFVQCVHVMTVQVC